MVTEAVLLAGLGFGDEGKGSVVDFLCRTRRVPMVVRYCGGAQAAHNVVLDDGTHHCFHQFGSGTLVPGVRTYLGPTMLVNPISLTVEERQLQGIDVTDAWERVYIDGQALITNPFHIAANRLREISRSGGRHGSCGLGINETVTDSFSQMEDAVRAQDIMDPGLLRKKLLKSWAHNLVKMTPVYAELPRTPNVQREWSVLSDRTLVDHIADAFLHVARKATIVPQDWLHDTIRTMDGTLVFEGSQGILLDEFAGFFPHVTRSQTTFRWAQALLKGTGIPAQKWGLIRTYMTRHGAGPMPTEAPGIHFPELHNQSTDPWQQTFRQGLLDLPLVRYAAMAADGVDRIVVTHMDRPTNIACVRYEDEEFLGRLPLGLAEQRKMMEALTAATPVYEHIDVLDSLRGIAPVVLTSSGPMPKDKRYVDGEREASAGNDGLHVGAGAA